MSLRSRMGLILLGDGLGSIPVDLIRHSFGDVWDLSLGTGLVGVFGVRGICLGQNWSLSLWKHECDDVRTGGPS